MKNSASVQKYLYLLLLTGYEEWWLHSARKLPLLGFLDRTDERSTNFTKILLFYPLYGRLFQLYPLKNQTQDEWPRLIPQKTFLVKLLGQRQIDFKAIYNIKRKVQMCSPVRPINKSPTSSFGLWADPISIKVCSHRQKALVVFRRKALYSRSSLSGLFLHSLRSQGSFYYICQFATEIKSMLSQTMLTATMTNRTMSLY